MADLDALFEELTEAQRTRRLPPVHTWHPEREGHIDIRIDSQGRWYHEGSEIRRQPLIDLFATILRKDDDGYVLVTPGEKLSIEVEDAPFIGVDLDVRGSASDMDLLVTTNVGDHVILDADRPLWMEGEIPYVMVRDALHARVHRNAFYRLVQHGVEEGGRLYVYSHGARFDLGPVA